jgi:hypothetical protein
MSTSVKTGWARQQYGRDRFDIQLDLADLPFIIAEYGVDEAGHKRMPHSVRIKVLRTEAEIIAKTVYYEHELAEARAAGSKVPSGAMVALKAEVPDLRTRRDDLLEPYMTDEAKARLRERRTRQALGSAPE